MSIFKTLAMSALSRRVLVGSGKRFIFIYHDISNIDAPQYSPNYSTQIERFHAQVEFLDKHFRLVPLYEIVSNKVTMRNELMASITFDDGFFSVKQTALPYLLEKNIPFSVFVSSMAIRENRLLNYSPHGDTSETYKTKVYLDEEDIKDLSRKGIEIGSHTSTHKALVNCDESTLRSEVLENKIYLESLVGGQTIHLALPFGKREHYDSQALNYCYASGHRYIYSSNPSFFGVAHLNNSHKLIPRIGLLNESPLELTFLINRPLIKKMNI